MDLWLTNPLEDVFRTSKKPYHGYHNRRIEHRIEIAQNARESIQLAIHTPEVTMKEITLEIREKNGNNDNGVTFDVGGVKLIHNSSNSINIDRKMVRAELPGELPQAIIKDKKDSILCRQSGSFFITANTTKDAKPGVYEYDVTIHYGTGKRNKPASVDYAFTVEVYPVCIPDARDSEYNHVVWTNCCGYSPDADNYKAMVETVADAYGIKLFSEEWFELIKNFAIQQKKERVNVVTVPLYPLLNENIKFGENGEYIFDFTLLDRFMDTFMEYGDVKYFCGFHLMSKTNLVIGLDESDNPDFPLVAYVFKEGHTYENFAWMYMNNEAVWKHLEMYVKGLYNHLKERGLTHMWLQHVCDEVAGEDAFNTVLKTYKLVHEWAPEFRTIDATWEDSLEKYGSNLDIHVPQIDIHDLFEEKYTEALKKNEFDVWSYTCLKPQFEFLSRLDDWKLIATRLIHWYNFKNNLKGYLHWSWNLWHYGQPWEDGCISGWPLDGWVVLPDVENLNVFETIRQRQCSSGIEDLELLKICEKIDSEKTHMLVDILIARANDFTLDTDLFFRVRKQLLLMASGK